VSAAEMWHPAKLATQASSKQVPPSYRVAAFRLLLSVASFLPLPICHINADVVIRAAHTRTEV
jgi:hypothetical protein